MSRLPRAWPTLAVLLVAAAFYTWTAATSDDLLDRSGRDDPYNALTTAFLDGRLSVDVPVDPRLAALPNPYDAEARAPFMTPQLLDLSYYEGKVYPYWGPAPALVAFVPFRLLGLGDLPSGVAVLVFSLIGLVASVLLLRLLARRLLPGTPEWMQAVAAAGLAFGNLAPFVLRRPEAYEIAISAGFAFSWCGLLCGTHALLSERHRLRWLAAAGALFGLAFASRPPLALGIGIVAVALVLLGRTDRRALLRGAAVLIVPFAVVFAAVLVYNAVRFDSPLQFGARYQLAGQEQDKYVDLAYLLPNLWHYLVVPPRPRAQFPFLWLDLVPNVPWRVPASYDAPERTAGILSTLPLLWLLVAAPFALRERSRALRLVVGALVGTGALLLLVVSLYYWGGIQRYEMDFATPLLVGAALVWFVVARGRWLRIAGTVAVVWTCVAMTALSMVGSDDRLRLRHPGTWTSLERFFSPVPTAMAAVSGGPIVASVGGDALNGPRRYDHLGVEGVGFYVGLDHIPIEVAAASSGPATLRARISRGPTTPRDTGRLLIEVATEDGSTFAAPVRGRVESLPVGLERGLNTLKVRVLAERSTGIAPAAQDDNGSIRVDDLQIEG